jgi:hypothetical protein
MEFPRHGPQAGAGPAAQYYGYQAHFLFQVLAHSGRDWRIEAGIEAGIGVLKISALKTHIVKQYL